jgi:hypothetical protein
MRWIFFRFSEFKPNSALKICLFFAVALSAAMALIGGYKRHPDEYHHFKAAQYYINHFLPPEIGDPKVRDSYSEYGVSYLNYHWIEYFFAGKFALLVSPIISDQLTAVRLSNVFLFFCLAIFFTYKARTDNDEFILPVFLLVTPQIWYIFSYFNNDAFALFISFVTAYQIANQNTVLNKFLKSEHFLENLFGGVFFGLLLGILLTLKTNYYTFIFFVGLWLLYEAFARKTVAPKFTFPLNLVKKYAFIFVIALSVLTFRCAADFYVNGETNFVGASYLNYFAGNFEHKEGRLLAYQEEVADPPYKPSTIKSDLMNTHFAMRLKDKGTSYSEIFSKWYWHENSFKSFVGVYGYMNVLAGERYYRVQFYLYLLFLAFLLFSLLITGRLNVIIPLAIFLSAACVTVFISSYLSWTYAFQAQGRYLFPIIPMLALLVYTNRQHLHNIILNVFIGCSFLLSVYSFVFVALKWAQAD